MSYSVVVQTSDHSYMNASKDVLLRIYVAFVEYGHQVSQTRLIHSYCSRKNISYKVYGYLY